MFLSADYTKGLGECASCTVYSPALQDSGLTEVKRGVSEIQPLQHLGAWLRATEPALDSWVPLWVWMTSSPLVQYMAGGEAAST